MTRERAEVADWLRAEISRGSYEPGTKLPSQRVLADRLGASPNTVAEALKILASEGVIRIRDRSGAVVLEPGASERLDPALSAKDALEEVQAEVRHVRRRLGELEQRVSEALAQLKP